MYLYKDSGGKVIYVGKAKSLRPRLSSYFQDLSALHARTQSMVTTAASVLEPLLIVKEPAMGQRSMRVESLKVMAIF